VIGNTSGSFTKSFRGGNQQGLMRRRESLERRASASPKALMIRKGDFAS